jgi:hypothetical protein
MGEHRSEPLREQRFLPGHVSFWGYFRRAFRLSDHNLLITIILHRTSWGSAGVNQVPVNVQ